MIYPNGAKVHGTWEKDSYISDDMPADINDDKYKVVKNHGSIIDNYALPE